MLTLKIRGKTFIRVSRKYKDRKEKGKEGSQARLKDKAPSTMGDTGSLMQGNLETVEVRAFKAWFGDPYSLRTKCDWSMTR